MKHRGHLKRRGLWLLGALLVIGAGAFGYHWAFGKAKVHYATATVERGDIESTVVAAGIVQPIKYVDVGAQTFGEFKSPKVIAFACAFLTYPPNATVTISLSTPISWSCNTPRPIYSRASAAPACASGVLSKYGETVSTASLRQVAVPRSRE